MVNELRKLVSVLVTSKKTATLLTHSDKSSVFCATVNKIGQRRLENMENGVLHTPPGSPCRTGSLSLGAAAV